MEREEEPLSSGLGTTRREKPDPGLGFQVKVPKTFRVAPFPCEDRVLDGPASGGKGSKGRNRSEADLAAGLDALDCLICAIDCIICAIDCLIDALDCPICAEINGPRGRPGRP